MKKLPDTQNSMQTQKKMKKSIETNLFISRHTTLPTWTILWTIKQISKNLKQFKSYEVHIL